MNEKIVKEWVESCKKAMAALNHLESLQEQIQTEFDGRLETWKKTDTAKEIEDSILNLDLSEWINEIDIASGVVFDK